MADQAVVEGIVGAEKLAETLNQWLGGIFHTIAAHGGDVYVVAGDAILAVWFPDGVIDATGAVAAAVQSSVSVQARGSAGGSRPRVRSSVSYGPIRYSELGGRAEEWHGVLSGHLFAELHDLNSQGTPGTVLVSRAAWQCISDRARGTRLPGGAVRIEASSIETSVRLSQPAHGSIAPQRLWTLVPPMVAGWMKDGLDVAHVGQFRTITVIFMLLEAPKADVGEDLQLLQSAVTAAQAACADLEGSIYQVLGDEKGVSIVAAYGLPPMSHEDDAARAIRTGFLLQQALAGLGLLPSIGIATGRAFCSVYGDGDRRQFALVGPVMNLAARLMQARQGLICDADTLRAARHHHSVDARELPPLNLKGKAAPVIVYTPFEAPVRGDVVVEQAGAAELIGRTHEAGVIDAALGMLEHGTGGAVVIEGEPGIGKSMLVGRALANSRSRQIQHLVGSSDDVEQSTSYFPWRSVFIEIFGIAGLDATAAGDRVKGQLEDDAVLAPLLNSLFSLRMPETPDTTRLSALARAETTRRILLARLARHVAATPTLLVLEDLHWFDSGSWSLLSGVAEAGLPLLLIATTRALGDVDAYTRLLADPGCRHLVLHGLTEDETSAVLAGALGTRRAAQDVASFVQARTAGNPFFVGELAKVLREAGTVLVVSGQVVMSPEVLLAGTNLDATLEARGIPATLEGVIVARSDRLPHTQQLVLRAASVVGRTFDVMALQAALPATTQAALSKDLEALVQEGLIASTRTPTAGAAYEFRHVLLRDVTYHGMSFSGRRVFHKAIALWMEQTSDGQAGALDTLLGYHFREAGETEPAARYLARAGEAAVRSYSNQEAATLLVSAIALSRAADATAAAQAARGTLELLLGRAYLALSRYAESKQHSEAGLALAGYRVPDSMSVLIPRLLGEATRQACYRYALTRPRHVSEEDRATLASAAIALEGLAEIYYYDGDGLKCLYASIRMLNLAEQLGPSPELARAYAAVSGITGLVRLRTTSANYRRHSLEMLDTIDDPGASAWALNLLGISRTGTGDWEDAATMFRRTAEIAAPLGERRRWRDGIENGAIVNACRGDWLTALNGIKEMRLSAERDGDQRYLLLAYREQAFLELQTRRFDDAARILPLIKAEIDRGIKAEELIALQDYHAIAGTVALERGEAVRAVEEADAALAASSGLSGSGSPPHRYWTLFLVGRIYLNLWRFDPDAKAAYERYSGKATAVYRLLKRLTEAHPIAAPSAFLVGGTSEWLRGRHHRARRDWQRALSAASALGMKYETALARAGLQRLDAHREDVPTVEGLPLLASGSMGTIETHR